MAILQDHLNNIYTSLGVNYNDFVPPLGERDLLGWHLINITALLAGGAGGGGGIGPKGDKGDKGDPGPQGVSGVGTPGKSAYEIAIENGFAGTEAEWLNFLKAEIQSVTNAEIQQIIDNL